jgi:hypothetical protein
VQEGSSDVYAPVIFETRRTLKNSDNPKARRVLQKTSSELFEGRSSEINPDCENKLDSLFPIYYIACKKRTMEETDL